MANTITLRLTDVATGQTVEHTGTARAFTSRDEAIQRAIIDPIEASGEVADARATYDVEAIAAKVLAGYEQGYACLDADEFWRIVEQHERQHTARLTSTNSPSVHDGEVKHFDTLTVFLGDEEVAEVTVESSEDPAPYIAALQAEGWRVIDISGSDWIVEPAEHNRRPVDRELPPNSL